MMQRAKDQVQQSFNRAATTYSTAALLQRHVADQLVAFVQPQLSSAFSGTLLDAGCGTGYCLAPLQQRYPTAQCIALDFAEQMLRHIPGKANTHRICADIQNLPCAPQTIDTYVSSLAWQWCAPERASQEAARVLKPEGALFVATLIEETFREFDQCLKAIGHPPENHLLRCPPEAHIIAALEHAGLTALKTQTTTHTTYHRDFKSLRFSIRGVGANQRAHPPSTTINRTTRSQLIDAYESLRTQAGLPLSYRVLYLYARRT